MGGNWELNNFTIELMIADFLALCHFVKVSYICEIVLMYWERMYAYVVT